MYPRINLYMTPYTIYRVSSRLTAEFQNVDTSGKFLTIYEAIFTFWGYTYLYFHVYMKGKPHKYETKMFELREAITGYVYLEAYAGASPTDHINSNHSTL